MDTWHRVLVQSAATEHLLSTASLEKFACLFPLYASLHMYFVPVARTSDSSWVRVDSGYYVALTLKFKMPMA